jgi:Kdo2-lipid IVA lauroyltransferase/acyltransferase
MGSSKNTLKKVRRSVRYPLLYGLIKTMAFVSSLIPRAAWIKFCGGLGRLSYYFTVKSRKRVQKHLAMVYGTEKPPAELLQLSKDVFKMLGRNTGDLIQAFSVNTREAYEKIRIINGAEYLENAYNKGKGVVLLTAHLGPFEYIGTELSVRGYKPLIVGTKLKDERLNTLLQSQRNKMGATLVERGKDTVKLVKNLKMGGTMIILNDQDTKVKSVFIDFLGIPAATPIGPTIMAMKTGALVVPMFTHLRDDFKLQVDCYPEIEMINTGNEEQDLITNTQRLSQACELQIRKYPAQWVWMHERWKTRPGQEIQ